MMNKIISLYLSLYLSLACGCTDSKLKQVSLDNTNVYQWYDYLETNEYPHSEQRICITDFPDTEFIWTTTEITALENGKEHILVTGMPVWNAFFSDLNSDGFAELCSSVSIGSGIIDNRIIVYDIHNDKQYLLADRMNYDYILSMENGELTATKTPYWNINSDAEKGRLALEDDELIFAAY